MSRATAARLGRVILASLLVLVVAAPAAVAGNGKTAKPPQLPPNEIVGKVPRNYLQLPAMHVAMAADPANPETIRVLLLTAWIECDSPETASKMHSKTKLIAQEVQDRMKDHTLVDFRDPKGGAELAKDVIREAAKAVAPDVPIKDVLIRDLVMH